MNGVSLRFRLVAGLVVLMVAGLAVFGLTTYELYSNSQYHQLKNELQSSVMGVTQELFHDAGLSGPSGHGQQDTTAGSLDQQPSGYVPGEAHSGGPGLGPQLVPMPTPGVWGELLSSSGKVLYSITEPDWPKLSEALLSSVVSQPRIVTTGSVKGGTGWLVYVGPKSRGGYRCVVAISTANMTNSLHRLVLIEALGAAGLLVLLSVGAGLVLRRGLSPLERVSDTAGLIAAGQLDKRVPVESPRGEIGQLSTAFNTMLDEIEQAFAERDRTEERLRQFLSDASHELRTPLTSIQGFAELFRLGAEDPRLDKATIMRRIEEESARMKALVEDLLLLARLDEVRSANTVSVNVSVLAADACSDAIAVDPDRRVTLDAPEPLMVSGDEAHLRQSLANLVTNALRYSPPGSPFEVSALRRGATAEIVVRDHGPGLSPDALEHAFDRFWQKDASRSGKNAGLGLSIVAAIVAEHGGQVRAANASDGGAVFTLSLPLAASQEEAGECNRPPARYGSAVVP